MIWRKTCFQSPSCMRTRNKLNLLRNTKLNLLLLFLLGTVEDLCNCLFNVLFTRSTYNSIIVNEQSRFKNITTKKFHIHFESSMLKHENLWRSWYIIYKEKMVAGGVINLENLKDAEINDLLSKIFLVPLTPIKP